MLKLMIMRQHVKCNVRQHQQIHILVKISSSQEQVDNEISVSSDKIMHRKMFHPLEQTQYLGYSVQNIAYELNSF